MVRTEDSTIVQVMHPICCGLDVHKKSVVACLVVEDDSGLWSEQKTYGTFMSDLVKLREWLLENDCLTVAMESTGVYWRPVFHILEGFVQVTLVNARHTKNMPGRKTDASDAKWLASLLRHGLVKGSFIPPAEVRRWRDFTRARKTFVNSLGDYKRRVHKMLELANIKIDSVIKDLFGATGRNLIHLLLSGEAISLHDVEACMRGSLRGKHFKEKARQLFESIQGFFGDHEREILKQLMDVICYFQTQIEVTEERLRGLLGHHRDLIERLDEVPGIDMVAAHAVIAEVGPDLATFPTSAAFCAWMGVSPGNKESAGKSLSGSSPVHRNMLKSILIQVSWAAIKVKDSYFRDKYFRLKARLGSKKAILAIAHRIAKALFHIIKYGERYKELGKDYLSLLNIAKRYTYLSREAAVIGYMLVPKPV